MSDTKPINISKTSKTSKTSKSKPVKAPRARKSRSKKTPSAEEIIRLENGNADSESTIKLTKTKTTKTKTSKEKDSTDNKPSFPVNIIPYGDTQIKTVYHISDVHIHLFKRHDEYNDVFSKVLKYLKAERDGLEDKWSKSGCRELPCITVITGDILHCKSDLSPECVAMTYRLFKDIGSIMPLVIIPGNHDMNINNKMRMDSLTPIIGDLPDYYPIHYLDRTGLWYMGGCLFSHASIFDYYIIDPAIVKEELSRVVDKIQEDDVSKVTSIALYHGRINGVELFNGRRIEGEKAGSGALKRTITIGNFAGYDIGMFGDIHKHQFLDSKKSRGYAGSLIQQNYGEDLDNHGLIKWDIAARIGEFVHIPNNWGYYTFHLKSGKCAEIGRGVDGKEVILSRKFPGNLCSRVLYDNATTQVQLSAFGSMLGEKFNVMDYCCQSEAAALVSGGGKICNGSDEGEEGEEGSDGDSSGDSSNDSGIINIRDAECQNNMIKQIIDEEFEGVPEEDIETIMQINREANKLLNSRASLESGLGVDDSADAAGADGRRFQLIRLEFDNFFCYGPNNYVDFRECEGVIGIVASNHMGKSAIIDILLFALYDKFPRKGSAKDIVNIRKTEYRVKLELKMGSYYYVIEKSGQRTKTGGVGKTKCLFTCKHLQTGKMTNLGEMTAKKLKDRIANLFGSYEDMVNTNFSIQTNSTGFIDAENTSRRKELERVLRFDFINDLVKEANENYRHNKSVFEHLQKNLPPEIVQELAANIETKEGDVLALEKGRDRLSRQSNDAQVAIDNINTRINPDLDKKMDDILSEVEMSAADLSAKSSIGSSGGDDIETAIKRRKEELDNEKTQLATQLTDIGSSIRDSLSTIISDLDNGTTSRYTTELKWLAELKIEKIPSEDKSQLGALIAKLVEEAKNERVSVKEHLDNVNRDICDRRRKGISSYKVVNDENIREWLNGVKDGRRQLVLDKISELISKDEDRRKDLESQLEGYNKLDSAIESLEAKIVKCREKISKKREENDGLVSEDIPDILRREVSQGTQVADVQHDLEEAENAMVNAGYRFKGKKNEYKQFKNTIMKRGWLAEIETRISDVASKRRKLDANKRKIKEYEDRISGWEKELVGRRQELKAGEQVTRKLETITMRLAGLRDDISAWKANCEVERELQGMEESRDKLQQQYLDTKVTDKLSEVREQLANYSEIEVDKKRVKAQQKAIGSVKKQLDMLMKEVDANTKLQEELLEEMNAKSEIDRELADVVRELELARESLAGMRAQLKKMKEDCKDKVVKERMMNIYGLYRDCLKMIPMLLIARVQPLLERKVNDLLTAVTNFTVCFQITESRIDIYLNRSVYDKDADGRMILINNSSGFERFISSLAIRIALMEISQLPSPNMMAIDEGWSCFDNENIGNLQIILDHLSQKFDFILTISHLQVIRQHCDMQIGLEKDDSGFSNVHFG